MLHYIIIIIIIGSLFNVIKSNIQIMRSIKDLTNIPINVHKIN